MQYGQFIENGAAYEVLTPSTPAVWSNYLYNSGYLLEVSQTLQGKGYVVENYNRKPCMGGYRYFYLKDKKSGEVWNPNYVPLRKETERFSCIHGVWSSELTSLQNGIESSMEVFVPPEGSREIWTVTVKNLSEAKRELSSYCVFEFYDHGVMGGNCTYDNNSNIIYKYAFPYHIFYEEKEKAEKEKALFYMFSDKDPDSWDMSKYRFFGSWDENVMPAGVSNISLSKIEGEAEDFCGALSHNFVLLPGERFQFSVVAGAVCKKEEAESFKSYFCLKGAGEQREKTRHYWENLMGAFQIQTPDKNINAFANYWLKKQVILLAEQNRGTTYCPARNRLQDALGYAMLNTAEAKKKMFEVLALQNQNGFLQQWHFTDGAPPKGLCLLHHTDGPLWLVICLEFLIRQLGDKEILEEKVCYGDGGEDTVLRHMAAALCYMGIQTGQHGLCLIGDGDWNDPMNGLGRKGQGESLWSSMALVYAIRLFLPYLREKAPDDGKRLEEIQINMKEAIEEHGWKEEWYVAGFHDDGSPVGDFGGDNRLYLNTQSWAILAGVADKEKLEILKSTIKRLDTPFGPVLITPPFDKWEERYGRISLKKSGTTENGSVYCHASMFLAYAYALLRDGDALYETIWRTMPVNPENPPENNRQLPLYIPNYYYGLPESSNFGRSSQHYGTGTAAWMLMLIVEELLGVKASVKGLVVNPCLPEEWKEVTCIRTFNNAKYHIQIIRSEVPSITVDGIQIQGNLLPYEEGRSYKVSIKTGREKK